MIAERLASMEYAMANRNLAVGLGGTCVVILTFVLLFLNPVTFPGFNPWLFQLTLVVVVLAMFLYTFTGTLYFTLAAMRAIDDPRAVSFYRWGYVCFILGNVLLTLEPGLILVTANLWWAGGIALGLWAAFLLLLLETWRVWNTFPRSVPRF
jgi:hypothetical protein